MYRVTRELEFGELKVIVKELTVAEVRTWLNEPGNEEKKEFDLFTDLLTFDGIGIEELYRFTDLKKELIEELPPSAIAKISAVIKEINSVFFNQYLPALNQLRERLESNVKALADSNAA
jgi:hypothetical protein